MDRHVRILGVLNMVFGVAGAVVAILILIQFGGLSGVYAAFNEDIVGVVASILVCFQLLIAVPCIVSGYGVRKLQDWARVMLIVVSAVNILNFPIGTMIGAYGLWVLMTPETDPLFQNAAADSLRKTTKARAARKAKLALSAQDSPGGKKNKKARGSDTSVVPSPLE
jgi:hypothetical protein